MRQWQIVLFSMVLSALGLMPKLAYAEEVACRDNNPRYRCFRAEPGVTGQVDSWIARINVQIPAGQELVTYKHYDDANLSENWLQCQDGHLRYTNPVRNFARAQPMTTADYIRDQCPAGPDNVRRWVRAGHVYRVPRSAIPTPGDRDMLIAERLNGLRARGERITEQVILAAITEILTNETDTTGQRPDRRETSTALQAVVETFPLMTGSHSAVPTGTSPATTHSIPEMVSSNARVVYRMSGHDRYLVPFWLAIAGVLFLGMIIVAQRHQYRRISHAPTMVPPMSHDDDAEEIRALQKKLIEADRRADKASADVAKLRTDAKNKNAKVISAEMERKATLYDTFVKRWDEVNVQLKKIGMGRGIKEFLDGGTTGFMLMLGKCQDLMEQASKLEAELKAKTEAKAFIEAELNALRNAYMRIEGGGLSPEVLTRVCEENNMLRMHYPMQYNHVQREIASNKGVTVPPPAATILGLPSPQTGTTQTGIPVLLSSIPPAPLPRDLFGNAEAENQHLREQIELMGNQIAALQNAGQQYHGIIVEILRSLGISVDDIPSFELLKVDQPSEIVQDLYNKIMEVIDRLETENARLKSRLEENEQSLIAAKQRAEEAQSESLVLDSAKSEALVELAKTRKDLEGKLDEIAKLKVKLNDVQVNLNEAELYRIGLIYVSALRSKKIRDLESDHEELQQQFVIADRLNQYYSQFCESTGGESMLEIVGYAEVVHRVLTDQNSPKRADSQRLLDAMNTLFGRVVNLPHEAIKAVREVASGPVMVVPAFSAGLPPTGTE